MITVLRGTGEELRLRQTLKFHGFSEAALWLHTTSKDAAELLKEWEIYPRCMDSYPKEIGKGKHPYRVSLPKGKG